MYAHNRIPREIRDGRAAYTGAPYPDDGLAGAGVLADLATAPPSELPLVVARYAAVRAWLLRRDGAPSPLVDHAVSAAAEYLARVEGPGDDRALLTRLVGAGTAGTAALLDTAALAAAARGHHGGAAALHREAWRLRWEALGLPPSPS